MLPPTRPIVPCVPQCCEYCGEDLTRVGPDPNASWVHQVVELPRLDLEVTHFVRQRKACPCCGGTNWGPLPEGVPQGGVGPAFQGLCVLLTGRHRLSRRQARELLIDLFAWSPAVGTLSNLERATSLALVPAVEKVAAVVAAARVANADETGWRKGKERPTLWGIVTPEAILFHIGDRSRDTLEQLLPPNDWRHLVSDRYAVYDGVAAYLRGLCWAHLKRNFAEIGLRGTLAATVADWAAEGIKKLFDHWRHFRGGELTRPELQEAMVPVQEQFRTLLNMGAEGNCRKTAGFCQHLLDRWDALWTFTRVEGVEPTNNAAERALRAAVLWRKGSFGHRSEDGKRFVESMLTVVATLRLQERPILPFLTETCQAAITGSPPPPILPAAPT
jgi:transposase